MKKRTIVLTVVAVLVLLCAWYLWGPSHVPPGQDPLVSLTNTNFSEFERAFDGDSDAPRLVLLLSPT
jgi:hypothetical protein